MTGLGGWNVSGIGAWETMSYFVFTERGRVPRYSLPCCPPCMRNPLRYLTQSLSSIVVGRAPNVKGLIYRSQRGQPNPRVGCDLNVSRRTWLWIKAEG